MSYRVIIPNRYPDIIRPLLDSIKEYEGPRPPILIIADGHDRGYGYEKIRVDGRFSFPLFVNRGIERTYPNDIILLNDDVRLLEPTFEKLYMYSYAHPSIGILSPLIDGGCGNLFMRANRTDLWKTGSNISGFHFCCGRSGDRLSFACVYIKRALLDQIGHFDTNFSGHGFDDADMSIRTVKAGWKLAITNKLTVRHGNGGDIFVRGDNWNTSFLRRGGYSARDNLDYLVSKYPMTERSIKI